MENLKYNTQLRELTLPEYGRNIHNIIDFCTGLEDREERTRCAYSIIDIMGNMFPHLRDVSDFKHILWDHLAIMSNFELDIDYPYPVVTKEEINTRPDPVTYSRQTMRFRHYGKIIEKMIQLAIEMEEGEAKEQFIVLVATQMKKAYVHWNKEVDDQKIFFDLFELSSKKLDLRDSNIKLPEVKEQGQQRQSGSGGGGRSKRKR